LQRIQETTLSINEAARSTAAQEAATLSMNEATRSTAAQEAAALERSYFR
jgi:hypothetical protein